jgi:predicted anti-sigma-YlaC factor YlaD
MKCDDVKNLLPFYAGKDLSQNQMEIICEHLENCVDCMGEYNKINNVLKIVNEAHESAKFDTSPDFIPKVYKKIADRRKFVRFLHRSLSAAAVFIFVFGISSLWMLDIRNERIHLSEISESNNVYAIESMLDINDVMELSASREKDLMNTLNYPEYIDFNMDDINYLVKE